MRIKTADKELLESETFLALGLGKTVVEFDEGDGAIQLIFNFSEDKSSKQATAEWNAVDSTTLNILLTNWNSPTGLTLTEPVEIGTYRGRQLFMVFSVVRISTPDPLRKVSLFLYLGEEVQNGDN